MPTRYSSRTGWSYYNRFLGRLGVPKSWGYGVIVGELGRLTQREPLVTTCLPSGTCYRSSS